MKSRIKKIVKFVLITLSIFFLLMVAGNLWVTQSTKDKIYINAEDVPYNDVALVLGTSKYYRTGKSNLFFKYRINAAIILYKIGKVKHFILSGDSSTYYNEPREMKKALMAGGIPMSAITLDYYGFRTFDSVVRSKKVFKQRKLTIITQDFYAHRALFISEHNGIEAIAFATKYVPGSFSFIPLCREYFARCKSIVDIYLLRKQPRILGEEVDIPVN